MSTPDDKLHRADDAIDHAADKLQEQAERAAADGGLKGKLAQPLADDAEFLRKLKPSLILARARGQLPTDGTPGHAPAPRGPQLGPRPGNGGGGPSPLVIVAAAFAVGILLAKLIDWRSHAHPRR